MIFKEDDIKNSLLDNMSLFERFNVNEQTKVVFEKKFLVPDVLNKINLISDALIFAPSTIIGIEFKTKNDNLKRLENQLYNYTLCLPYTYVYCHDEHLEEVIKLLNKRKRFQCVGVISYEEFGNSGIAGIVKEAKESPNFSYKVCVNSLLTKKDLFELESVYLRNKGDNNIVGSQKGQHRGRHVTENFLDNLSYVSSTWTKSMLLKNYISIFTKETGLHLISKLYSSPDFNAYKNLNIFDFAHNYKKGSKAWTEYDKRKYFNQKHLYNKPRR